MYRVEAYFRISKILSPKKAEYNKQNLNESNNGEVKSRNQTVSHLVYTFLPKNQMRSSMHLRIPSCPTITTALYTANDQNKKGFG